MDLPLPGEPGDAVAQAKRDRHRLGRAALGAFAFVALLWWIKLIEVWLDQSFAGLGVRPGSLLGLVGIASGPLLHGSLDHLVGNTLPMLLLGTLTFSVYPKSAARAVLLIWLLSGLGTWLFGRESTHIGASGLAHGLMFFLFTLGALRRDRPAVATAMIAFFMYGGMLLSVLPGDPAISWESHLFGAISGALAALLWSRRDPAPPRKRYSWEDEDESDAALEDPWAIEQRAQFEPPRPEQVPVLWQRDSDAPAKDAADRPGQVLPFRPRPSPPEEPPAER